MRRPVLVSAALVALSAALCVGAVGPAAAQTADPAPTSTTGDAVTAADADIARLGAEAEALSGRYFETLGRLAEVQGRIDEIEARLPTLASGVADLRVRTRERAVTAYKRSGNDLGSVIGAADPLEAARRVQWLDRLNARDEQLVAELEAATTRLAAQRAELQSAREAASTALDDVKRQGEAIDALLVDAQERRRVALTPPTTAAATPEPVATPSTPAAGAPTTTTVATSTTTAPRSGPPAAPPTYTPTPGTHPAHDEPFLVCTRTRESSGRYTAYNPAGPYMGAYQFLQSTWNSAANHAGRPDLIGVPPHTASPYDQDQVAWALYQWQGSGPWGGRCDPE